MQRLSICIITCRRPLSLENLLESLSQLRLPDRFPYQVRIVIVDNDPVTSAEPVAAKWKTKGRFPVAYSHEPRRGIPFARNRCVEMTAGDDLIAFIDDDEVADPDWLAELVGTHRKYQAPIVAGPVLRRFESPPPRWVEAVGLFSEQRASDGEIVHNTGTGNVLIVRSVLDGIEGPFDTRLALTGGSDSVLFEVLKRRGHRIRWSEHAIARETVPASRLTLRWVLARSFRTGANTLHCTGIVDRSIVWRVVKMLRGVFRVVKGLLLMIVAIVGFRKVLFIKALQHLFRGAGMVYGFCGFTYKEYREIHGG